MRVDVKKCMLLGLSVTGTIIGVGFASGREIVSFFARFGFWSLAMCFVSSVFFATLCYLLFAMTKTDISHKNKNCKAYKNELKLNIKVSKWLSKTDKVFDFFLMIAQIIICSAMIAGVGEILSLLGIDGVSSFVLKIGIIVGVYFYLSKFRNGVLGVNRVLSLIMVLFIFVIFIALLVNGDYNAVADTQSSFKMLYLPILYMSMNFFTAYPVIENLSHSLKCGKEKFLASVFVGICVFVPLCLVCLCVLLFGGALISDVMIMHSLASGLSGVVGGLYLILILFAIVTTLLSTAFGAVSVISRKYSDKNSIRFVLFVSFLISLLGFGSIVDVVYPILGVICLFLLVVRVFLLCHIKKCKIADK